MKRSFIFITVMIIFLTVVNGQNISPVNDSLSFYMIIAAQQNPVVLRKLSEYKAALAKVSGTGTLSDPELTTGIYATPMELPEGVQIADFQLMQMFPWFGTNNAAKNEMSLMARSKLEELNSAKLDIFYDVQRTMYAMYRNVQEQKIIRQNLEILKTIERLSIVRYKTSSTVNDFNQPSPGGKSGNRAEPSSSGMGNDGGQSATRSSTTMNPSSGSMGEKNNSPGLADLFQIQIESGDLNDQISSLENDQQTLKARFNSFLGRPLNTPVAIPDTLIFDKLFILPHYSDSLFIDNPMLGMIRYEQQSLDARKKMSQRMGLPMFGLGIDYSLMKKSMNSQSEMNGKDMIMPMVKLTLPVYRKKYNSAISEAELLKNAAEYNYEATKLSLQSEYYEAMQMYRDALRRYKLYSSQADLSNRTLMLTITGFSASGSSLTDILRINQRNLEYQFKKTEAVTDLFTSVAWIQKIIASEKLK